MKQTIAALLLCSAIFAQDKPVLRVRPGESFALRLDGFKAEHVNSLTVTLASDCDDDERFESGATYKSHGSYYAVFQVPDNAEPCTYSVHDLRYWSDDDQDYPYSQSLSLTIEVAR